MAKYRIVENASREERAMGYHWDLQLGEIVNNEICWRPYIAYKTKYEAEAELEELTKL